MKMSYSCGILPVESLPSRASHREPQSLKTGSNDQFYKIKIERSVSLILVRLRRIYQSVIEKGGIKD
jgi:hypothetical protein